ncbi:MAG: MarR family winged helix-turn-helix transcriptional regulator [Acidobacteriaceae bacterium]|jgi:DNA-binding MarR family transcriptional regulator
MNLSTAKRAALHSSLNVQIRQLIAGTILFNQKIADAAGLRLTDMQCMNVLDLLGPSTPGKLAECTGLTTGGVTVMLDRMERAGFVKRSPNPNDRRSVVVSVNPKRLKKLHTYYDQINRQTVAIFSEFPEADLEVVASFFSRLNAIRR